LERAGNASHGFRPGFASASRVPIARYTWSIGRIPIRTGARACGNRSVVKVYSDKQIRGAGWHSLKEDWAPLA